MNETKDFSRILVGVDNSDDAQKAFQYAIKRSKETDAELLITSILEDHDMNVYEVLDDDFIHGKREDVEKHVEQYINIAKEAGIKNVHGIVDEGNPGEVIVDTIIPNYKPDLLIIGSLDIKGPKKVFGSQAAHMAKLSPISVLVIR